MKMFKLGFRKLSILSKILGMTHRVGGEWGNLVCVIMTHFPQKPICDSPLTQITFHVVKKSYVPVTSKDIFLLFIILFLYLI